jgi:hypothetical protein
MPGPHPDDNVLADLAADVLPVAEARAVEAHVLECDRCAELLSDAERVRGLLLADDPGPVPPEVWNRIEATLAAEARHHRQTRPWIPAGPTASPSVSASASPPAPTSPPAPASPLAPASQDDLRAGWDGPDPLDAPDRWGAEPVSAVGGADRSRTERSPVDRSGAEPLPAAAARRCQGKLAIRPRRPSPPACHALSAAA